MNLDQPHARQAPKLLYVISGPPESYLEGIRIYCEFQVAVFHPESFMNVHDVRAWASIFPALHCSFTAVAAKEIGLFWGVGGVVGAVFLLLLPKRQIGKTRATEWGSSPVKRHSRLVLKRSLTSS